MAFTGARPPRVVVGWENGQPNLAGRVYKANFYDNSQVIKASGRAGGDLGLAGGINII